GVPTSEPSVSTKPCPPRSWRGRVLPSPHRGRRTATRGARSPSELCPEGRLHMRTLPDRDLRPARGRGPGRRTPPRERLCRGPAPTDPFKPPWCGEGHRVPRARG